MQKRQEKGKPRILVVTPEITYLPEGMGNMGNILRAKAGGDWPMYPPRWWVRFSGRGPTCMWRCPH